MPQQTILQTNCTCSSQNKAKNDTELKTHICAKQPDTYRVLGEKVQKRNYQHKVIQDKHKISIQQMVEGNLLEMNKYSLPSKKQKIVKKQVKHQNNTLLSFVQRDRSGAVKVSPRFNGQVDPSSDEDEENFSVSIILDDVDEQEQNDYIESKITSDTSKTLGNKQFPTVPPLNLKSIIEKQIKDDKDYQVLENEKEKEELDQMIFQKSLTQQQLAEELKKAQNDLEEAEDEQYEKRLESSRKGVQLDDQEAKAAAIETLRLETERIEFEQKLVQLDIEENENKRRETIKTIYKKALSKGDIRRIAGTYLQGTIIIEGDNITIDRSHLGRPNGTGKIQGNKGYVNFPDHRSFTLEYNEMDKALYLDGKKSGIKWTKNL